MPEIENHPIHHYMFSPTWFKFCWTTKLRSGPGARFIKEILGWT